LARNRRPFYTANRMFEYGFEEGIDYQAINKYVKQQKALKMFEYGFQENTDYAMYQTVHPNKSRKIQAVA